MNAHDRCDKCGAQAQVKLELKTWAGEGPRDLMFCGHHYNEYAPTLSMQGFAIVKTDQDEEELTPA